jgi:tetratricopeptide (TPR) repeat protein
MLGFVLFVKGEFAAARVALEHAIGLYRTIMPFYLPQNAIQDPLIVCLAVSPPLLHALGDAGAAERMAEALIVHARSLGRDYDLAYSLCWRALFEITRGLPERARGFAEEALAISVSNDFRLWNAVSGLMLLFASAGSGPRDDAVARAKAFMAELDRIGLHLMRSFYLWQIARLELAGGDADDALATIDRAIAFSEAYGERVLLSRLHGSRGEILLQLQQNDAAVAALRRAREVAEAQGAIGFSDRNHPLETVENISQKSDASRTTSANHITNS